MDIVRSNKKLFSIILFLTTILVEVLLNFVLEKELLLHDHFMIFASLVIALVALNRNVILGLLSAFVVVLVYGVFVIFATTTSDFQNVEIEYVYIILPVALAYLFGILGSVNQKLIGMSDEFSEHYKELVRVDELTGFRNKNDFYNDLDNEIARITRYGGSLSLMLIYIESFEDMNHKYGINQGNKFLKFLSEFIVELTRNVDKHYRLNSDVFAIVLPQTNDAGANILKARFSEDVEKLDILVQNNREQIDIDIDLDYLEYSKDLKDAFSFEKAVENKIRKR